MLEGSGAPRVGQGTDVTVEDLHFAYPNGVQVLKGVTLRIEQGEAVALVGPNGAGKTTLAKHFDGLLLPTSGRVLLGGWDTRTRRPDELARRVALVFPRPSDQLFLRTVRDEVRFGPDNLGLSRPRAHALVDEALHLLRLTLLAARHPYDLGASERRLVTIAAALAMDTPVVVLDEPTDGLDTQGRRRLGDVMARLTGAGKTVIAISHDTDFLAEHCTRVIVLTDGQVAYDGPREGVWWEGRPGVPAGRMPVLAQLARRLGFSRPAYTIAGVLDALRSRSAPPA